MKFSQVLIALAATAAQAKPIAAERDVTASEAQPFLEPSWNSTDAPFNTLAAVVFTLWDNTGCNGNSLTITADSGAKGNFPTKRSASLVSTIQGVHVSLYTQPGQKPSGSPNLRLDDGNLGQCWSLSGGWQSYGVFNN